MIRYISLLLITLSGCAVGPDYQAPSFKHDGAWHSGDNTMAAAEAVDSVTWWRQFDDPQLSSLIDAVLRHNRDLAVAVANVDRARASRRVAASGFYPGVDASASASRSRYSRQNVFGATSGTRNTFDAGLDASWELDLFGRVRRSVEAADARIGASRALHDGVTLAVTAEVAASYFELRGLQRRLVMQRHNITLLREVELIVTAQSELGVTSRLDVARAKGERESIEADLPTLEAEVMLRIYRISVLAGEAPEFYADRLSKDAGFPEVSDRVPVGLRSQVLRRRPDVRLAERELAAATADIGVAYADLFPDFSLTGAVGSSARLFSDLFTPNTLTSSLGAALGWPLFAGGAIMGRIDLAEADAIASLANYEQRVLLALEDAESALTRYARAWQRLKRLRLAEQSRNEAFAIAKLRYEAGEEGFMAILDAERALIATRNDIVVTETAILTGLTQLYKAFGGGWKQSEAVAQAEQEVDR